MTENEIVKNVEERAKRELEAEGRVKSDMLGYINILEKRKKEILDKEYGIKYQTVAEKNWGCSVD